MNEASPDADADPSDSHRLTFSAPKDSVWLFTASVNNPDATLAPIVVQRWIVVGHGPRPPPAPKPDPVDPDVDPEPKPVPAGFRVLILRDQDKDHQLPREQYAAIQSPVIRNYLTANCDKESDGSPAFRSWDDSYTDDQITDGDWLPKYREALADSGGKLPWVTIWHGSQKGYSKELPANETALLDLFKKNGGK
jgi:hypothetical protein